MKMLLLLMSGLTIGTLITISAFQLFKVVFQELVNMVQEAWASAEQR